MRGVGGAPQTLEQGEGVSERFRRAGVLTLLALSATCLAVAPLALPASYSWVVHSTSESAAQGLSGAWIARLGFLLFGFAVLWLTSFARPRWGRWGALLLGTFGVMMLATAAFSHRPWLPDVPFDGFEDFLHSVTATVMGVAFAVGVVMVGVGRERPSRSDRAVDLFAVVCSVVIPLAMSLDTGLTGLLQRFMFLVGYVWYGREAIRGQAASTTEASVP